MQSTLPANIFLFPFDVNIVPPSEQNKLQNLSRLTIGYHQDKMELATLDFCDPHARIDLNDWSTETLESTKTTTNSTPLSSFTPNQTKSTTHVDQQSELAIHSITLNVNQICNLHCNYCAAGGDGSFGDPIKSISVENTLPQLQWMLARLKPGQKFHINFLGGEPLLHPKSIELICEYVHNTATANLIQSQFSITTNGTLIDEQVLSLFKKYHFNISVSVDGPAEINDQVRPSKNKLLSTTASVVSGLLALNTIKSDIGYVKAVGTFGQHNLELVKAYEFYLQFPVFDLFVFQLDHNNTSAAVSEIFTEQMQKIAKLAFANEGEVGLRKLEYYDRLFEKLDQQRPSLNYCGAGKTYVMVDAKNQIFSCPWDVNESQSQLGVGTYISKEKSVLYQRNQVEKPDCQKCWAKLICGGGCSYIHRVSQAFHTQQKLNLTEPVTETSKTFCDRERSLIKTGLMYYLLSRRDSYES